MRNQNKRADELANLAMDTKHSHGFEELGESKALYEEANGDEGTVQKEQPELEELPSNAGPLPSNQTYLLRVDGAARGNPGEAGAGMVIYDPNGREVWFGWKYIARATNNTAEYSALVLGLQCAKSLGISRLNVETDSMLVVRQVEGSYRVKDAKLKPLHADVVDEMEGFEYVEISHTVRADNARADELANLAVDNRDFHGWK